MRKHADPAGTVCSVTITRRELSARRHERDRRGRAYVWVRSAGGTERVRAMVVPDGSPEARPARCDR